MEIPITHVWFSLKSILIGHLNHSNRIRNEKLWPKYENWSKLENRTGLYRYMSNLYRYKLAKNDQNTLCTGTSSNCTGTSLRKMPRMVFSPLFHALFHPKPNLYFIYTSKSFQIHLEASIILKSSFNGYLSSKFFHESFQEPF